ncbi:Na+/H+ antiporter NhaA [Olivibacter sp. SDN3]|uniref:Na+/H+ antiporter NhaA n=1 Tax=Olivibacter sp. SDN3 TaxID=2764720 RepID=UPI001650FD58|nr:Na+/H+ antiporter NhaA [Olivibacter sp. SDN3]QNL52676.1 Na+/H+ antiporter NhaA [Olivibacter sp. SDN3]
MTSPTYSNRLKNFLFSNTGPGILLMACVVISLTVANSPLGAGFEKFLDKEIGYESQALHLRYPIILWINDGLMAIFFLLVGLEIKRELMDGELSSARKAALPVFAALGGVVMPAAIYALLNHGTETASGWAIPMATDIAFALAIITLLGKKVPITLKIFLAALAIVDDLMAILIIAIFYSGDLHYDYLMYAALLVAGLFTLNRLGVKNTAAYLVPAIFIWYFIHHSGIHATIAGVLTAFTIPSKSNGNAESPLLKLEHALSRPVNLLIMPIFALANTNITFVEGMFDGLISPLGLGIVLGLFIGKPLGIFLLSWISVKLGICAMPSHAGWKHLLGVGMLAGIGFTMSIFIALLSFSGEELLTAEAKFSVLVASVISGVVGSIFLSSISKKTDNKSASTNVEIAKES